MTRSATAVPSALEVRFSPLELLPPALFWSSRSGIAHVGDVLAVSRHERKSQQFHSCSRAIPSEVPEASFDVEGLTADEIQARVLHRDGLMLVIDKPAGLPVHRGPKGGANLEASFDGLQYGLPLAAGVLAHRLDKDTSGCLVLGRHRKATASLGLLFKHGKIGKTYWAVVEGGPAEDEGTIDMPLGRLNAERGTWAQNSIASCRECRRFIRFRIMSSPDCSDRCRCGIRRSSSAMTSSRSRSASMELIDEIRRRFSSGTWRCFVRCPSFGVPGRSAP